MSEYFPKPKPLTESVKVWLDLSNYGIKAELNTQQVLIYRNMLKWLI